MNQRVAVTGAAGFIGRAIVAHLAASGWRVRAITRQEANVRGASEAVAAGDLLAAALEPLVEGCDAVVHCAARVHVMKRENPAQAEIDYRDMNAELPVRLAECAKTAGVSHFVQLSSAAAIASRSAPGATISDDTPPHPTSPYGRSKLEADQRLQGLASDGFHIASLRPPAVFGIGVGAFFAQLDRAARAGLPLPLGRVTNRRSFVYAGNLADAVARVLGASRSGAWLLTDSPPMATADLYRRLLDLHGFGDRVWGWPTKLVSSGARLALDSRADSLLGDAAYDGRRFAQDFDWLAPTPLDAALRLTVTDRSA